MQQSKFGGLSQKANVDGTRSIPSSEVASDIFPPFCASPPLAACTKRGVLFILLLGFMLQSIVVIATDFFEYSTPDLEQYSFIGASCLLLLCVIVCCVFVLAALRARMCLPKSSTSGPNVENNHSSEGPQLHALLVRASLFQDDFKARK